MSHTESAAVNLRHISIIIIRRSEHFLFCTGLTLLFILPLSLSRLCLQHLDILFSPLHPEGAHSPARFLFLAGLKFPGNEHQTQVIDVNDKNQSFQLSRWLW